MTFADIRKLVVALVLAVVILGTATVAGNVFYTPVKDVAKRGYTVETVAAGAAVEPEKTLPELLALADVERGKKLAKKCLACHTLEKGQPDKVGPNLYGVLGGALAHSAGFAYSAGMQEKAKGGGRWDYASLNEWLTKPSAYIPGTKMTFAGFKKAKDRADMIAYLRSLSNAPVALPKP